MPFVRTRISVAGFKEAEVHDELPDLLDELRGRSWIIYPAASWDADRGRLVVTTHSEGTDTRTLSRAASEEIWDCVIACLDFSSGEIQFDTVESSVVQHVETVDAPDRGPASPPRDV